MHDLDITAELPIVEDVRFLVDCDPERVYVTRCPETQTNRSQTDGPNHKRSSVAKSNLG